MVPQLWLSGLSSLNRRRIENKKTITSTTQKRRTDCENTNSGSDGWLEKLMLPLPLLCLFRSVQHSLLLVEDTFLCTSQPVRHHTTALKWYSAPLRSNTLMGLFYKFYTQSPLAQEKDDFFTLMVRLWWWWIFFCFDFDSSQSRKCQDFDSDSRPVGWLYPFYFIADRKRLYLAFYSKKAYP